MIGSSDWENLPSDPESAEDLGYELIDLDVVRTEVDGNCRYLVLPSDEDLLRENAFMVASESSVCDLSDRV